MKKADVEKAVINKGMKNLRLHWNFYMLGFLQFAQFESELKKPVDLKQFYNLMEGGKK